MTEYKQREITEPLLGALKDIPVVMLTGMRQVGKSTLIQEEPALKDRRYINLDDFSQLKSARRWNERDLSGLKAFNSTTPNCRAAILAYDGTEAVRLDKQIWAIPLGLLLS